MKILKIIDKKTQAEVIKECRAKLVALNIAFTNNVVYKIMKIIDEKSLFEIKDRAKMFQEEIFYMIHLLIQSNQKCDLLYKDLYFSDGQASLFAEEENFTKLHKSKKSFNGLYKEIQDKLKSYESFINKQLKLADRIQKKHKQKQYKKENEIQSVSKSNNFKGLNDTILSLYFKHYEKCKNQYYSELKKTEGISFSNGEHELMINLAVINIATMFFKTQEELDKLEDYYYKLFPNDFKKTSNRFKKDVINFSKTIKEFSETLKSIQNTR